MPSMEAPLLTVTETENKVGGDAGCSLWSEVKKQLYLAGPLIVGYLLVNIIQIISTMFVGHLGKLELASVSVATSFASVTGMAVLGGMSSGLDTLCGQAFGAGQHRLLGVHKQRAMLVLTLFAVPVAAVWAYAGEILAWSGQDPEIAAAAGSYMLWLIPSLFVFGLLQCHIRFLQTQKLVLPQMLSSGAAALGHPVICWLLVHRLGLGSKGAALANAVSYLVNLSLMAFYVRLSPSCKDTWTGFSGEAFRGIPGFLKLAVPSAAMACMEWWSFELMVLLAGLLPNPKLETAVLSICLQTKNFVVMVPIGLGAAVSIRVSNELGAGRPHAARRAARVVMFVAFSVSVAGGFVMVLARNLLGYAFSSDEEVAKYAARVMPVLAVCILFAGLQTVLSGVVTGCGRQKLGTVINFVAYYIAGIPAAFFFAFVCHLGGVGLWFGLLCGLVVQMLLLLSISVCTNWNGEVLRAKDGVFSSNSSVDI